jgi:hypothetical protein
MLARHRAKGRAMAEIVNLNRFRKAKAKAEAGRIAENNRVKFGRTKAERQADLKLSEKAEADLSGKKLED